MAVLTVVLHMAVPYCCPAHGCTLLLSCTWLYPIVVLHMAVPYCCPAHGCILLLSCRWPGPRYLLVVHGCQETQLHQLPPPLHHMSTLLALPPLQEKQHQHYVKLLLQQQVVNDTQTVTIYKYLFYVGNINYCFVFDRNIPLNNMPIIIYKIFRMGSFKNVI